MQEYLLKVSKPAERDVASWLSLKAPPTHVRMATLVPLSAYGHPAGSEASVIRISDHGVVTGDESIPHDFVPWQNIAYVTDGSQLAKDLASGKRK